MFNISIKVLGHLMTFMCKYNLWLVLLLATLNLTAFAQNKIETLSVDGTNRMSAEQVATAAGLSDGTIIDDAAIEVARARLLSLGLFREIIFSQKRGSQPGLVHLKVLCKDDTSVLDKWAIGGETGVSFAKPESGKRTPFQSYRLGLVSRNLFSVQHRAGVAIDLDHQGALQKAQIGYGLPRFIVEDIQYSAGVNLVNPSARYLDALGFGIRGDNLWIRPSNYGDFVYGVSAYGNLGRFAMPEFPERVIGPKLGLFRETRFLGFLPTQGYQIGAAVVPAESGKFVTESALAGTKSIFEIIYLTAELRALTVGSKGVSVRSEGRLELPFRGPKGRQAILFTRARLGVDRFKSSDLFGKEAAVGFRYHSSGFITDLQAIIENTPDGPNNL